MYCPPKVLGRPFGRSVLGPASGVFVLQQQTTTVRCYRKALSRPDCPSLIAPLAWARKMGMRGPVSEGASCLAPWAQQLHCDCHSLVSIRPAFTEARGNGLGVRISAMFFDIAAGVVVQLLSLHVFPLHFSLLLLLFFLKPPLQYKSAPVRP